jgi:hypothetical protein
MTYQGYDAGMGAYDGMTDNQLMDLAKRALVAAVAEPVGSIERAMKWAGHESIMNELRRRIVVHAVRKLNAELGLPDVDL